MNRKEVSHQKPCDQLIDWWNKVMHDELLEHVFAARPTLVSELGDIMDGLESEEDEMKRLREAEEVRMRGRVLSNPRATALDSSGVQSGHEIIVPENCSTSVGASPRHPFSVSPLEAHPVLHPLCRISGLLRRLAAGLPLEILAISSRYTSRFQQSEGWPRQRIEPKHRKNNSCVSMRSSVLLPIKGRFKSESRTQEDAQKIHNRTEKQDNRSNRESKVATELGSSAKSSSLSHGEPEDEKCNVSCKEIRDAELENYLNNSNPMRRVSKTMKHIMEPPQLQPNGETSKDSKGENRLQFLLRKLVSTLQTVLAYFLVVGGIVTLILIPLVLLYKLLGF